MWPINARIGRPLVSDNKKKILFWSRATPSKNWQKWSQLYNGYSLSKACRNKSWSACKCSIRPFRDPSLSRSRFFGGILVDRNYFNSVCNFSVTERKKKTCKHHNHTQNIHPAARTQTSRNIEWYVPRAVFSFCLFGSVCAALANLCNGTHGYALPVRFMYLFHWTFTWIMLLQIFNSVNVNFLLIALVCRCRCQVVKKFTISTFCDLQNWNRQFNPRKTTKRIIQNACSRPNFPIARLTKWYVVMYNIRFRSAVFSTHNVKMGPQFALHNNVFVKAHSPQSPLPQTATQNKTAIFASYLIMHLPESKFHRSLC